MCWTGCGEKDMRCRYGNLNLNFKNNSKGLVASGANGMGGAMLGFCLVALL